MALTSIEIRALCYSDSSNVSTKPLMNSSLSTPLYSRNIASVFMEQNGIFTELKEKKESIVTIGSEDRKIESLTIY